MKKEYKKGFTLLELLIVLAFIAVATALVYGIYNKTDDRRKSYNEMLNISSFIKSVEGIGESTGGFIDISNDKFKDLGIEFSSEFKSTVVSTPSNSRLEIEYKDINSKVCTEMASSAETRLGALSGVAVTVNGTQLNTPISPTEAASNCSNEINNLTIALVKTTIRPLVDVAQDSPSSAPPIIYPGDKTILPTIPAFSVAAPQAVGAVTVTSLSAGAISSTTVPTSSAPVVISPGVGASYGGITGIVVPSNVGTANAGTPTINPVNGVRIVNKDVPVCVSGYGVDGNPLYSTAFWKCSASSTRRENVNIRIVFPSTTATTGSVYFIFPNTTDTNRGLVYSSCTDGRPVNGPTYTNNTYSLTWPSMGSLADQNLMTEAIYNNINGFVFNCQEIT